jgi:hypothetical protein
MNTLTERQGTNVATPKTEAEIIYQAAQADAGFDKMLKFKKGIYECDGDEIGLGTQYIAHALGWTKVWVKFVDGTPTERRVYRVLKGEAAPERHDMPDTDDSKWEVDPAGRKMDPWSYQYMLPMEKVGEEGQLVVFVTASFGGRRAVADLCTAWSRQTVRTPGCGMPIVSLNKTMMPSKKWGDVPRPYFEIVGWDGTARDVREVRTENLKEEMNDEIPF